MCWESRGEGGGVGEHAMLSTTGGAPCHSADLSMCAQSVAASTRRVCAEPEAMSLVREMGERSLLCTERMANEEASDSRNGTQ